MKRKNVQCFYMISNPIYARKTTYSAFAAVAVLERNSDVCISTSMHVNGEIIVLYSVSSATFKKNYSFISMCKLYHKYDIYFGDDCSRIYFVRGVGKGLQSGYLGIIGSGFGLG